MGRLEAFPIEGSVIVTPHAVAQAQARWGDELSALSERDAATEIARQVRDAVAKGQVFDRKPKPFLLYGEGGNILPFWQRFVQSPCQEKAWVVALDHLPDVVVVTSLNRMAKIARPA